MAIALTPPLVLSDELLDGIAERADGYDRAGQFFDEDFEGLRDIGYYRAPVPVGLGGGGLRLQRTGRCTGGSPTAQRRNRPGLRDAPVLGRGGGGPGTATPSPEWILTAAAAGEIFAAGHSEPGNDLALWGSTTEARPDGDGYAFYGRKLFTPLSPVWTILGVHGADTTGPGGDKIIHGFVSRDDPRRREETLDTFALRATRSDDTVLDGARSPAGQIISGPVPGHAGESFLITVAAWAVVLTSNVYLAIAQRALDLAAQVASGPDKQPARRVPAQRGPVHPGHLRCGGRRTRRDRGTPGHGGRGVDRAAGRGPPRKRRLLAAKQHATLGAKRVVDSSLQVIGGRSLRRGSLIERLYRDVAAGVLHDPRPTLSCGRWDRPSSSARAASRDDRAAEPCAPAVAGGRGGPQQLHPRRAGAAPEPVHGEPARQAAGTQGRHRFDRPRTAGREADTTRS